MPVPASIVVDVDDTVRPSGQATLHQLVIRTDRSGVECATKLAVHQVLPRYRQPKDIELVVRDEVTHLAGTVSSGIHSGRETRSGTVHTRDLTGALRRRMSLCTLIRGFGIDLHQCHSQNQSQRC